MYFLLRFVKHVEKYLSDFGEFRLQILTAAHRLRLSPLPPSSVCLRSLAE